MIKAEKMEAETVLAELEALGTEQTKKTYRRHGAKEPLFGVTTGAMKPLLRRIRRDHELAMELYDTGIYDAMYFAGMIADPTVMTQSDFEHWIETAYCHGLADYVVAVTLAETDFAQVVAVRWIKSKKELVASAGWSCFTWLLGVKPDSFFDKAKIERLLGKVEKSIHSSPNRVRYSMNGFLIAVGISYLPLHELALEIARKIGPVQVHMGETNCKTPVAYNEIQKAIQKERLGFKRRNVRC